MGNNQRGAIGQACPTDNENCADLLNLATCGGYCAPSQDTFTSDDGTQRFVCTDYVKNMYKTCKNEQMWDPTKRECRKVSDTYGDEDEFFTGVIAPATAFTGHQDSDCWNASSFTAPGVSLVLALAAALFGVRSPVLILALVAVAIPLASAKCYAGVASIKVDNMCGCEWYQEDTCNAMNAAQPYSDNSGVGQCIKSSMYKEQYACKEEWPSECTNLLNAAACAGDYSPMSYEFHLDANGTSATATQYMCKDQAEATYKACKDALMWDGAKQECRKMGDIYSSSDLWVTVMGWEQRDGSDNCWNPASTIFASIALLVSFAIALA